MPVIRFIISLFKKQEEEAEPPEPPSDILNTIKKVKIPLWLF